MSDLSDAIFKGLKNVTKKWTKQRKAEDRGSRSRSSRVYIYSDRVWCPEVADLILPWAYAHASGNGRFSVFQRQLYYACRQAFLDKTGEPLSYGNFTGSVLPKYMNRFPEKTASWRITASPRGTLIIPNASHDVNIPCGTIEIDNHLRKVGMRHQAFDDLENISAHIEWPALAAGQRYRAVLYIEKEGFNPLFEEARLAERFNIAILSCKGQSVVAARRFIDEVCAVGNGVPLLTVHDFDKPGFEIAQRLTSVSLQQEENDTVKYRFENEIDSHDIGLRLADVHKYDLERHVEECTFRGRFPKDTITMPEEQEFLQSGRRVELNAMTSPQIVEWLETRLAEHLKGPFIPNDDEVLEAAYRRAHAAAKINRAVEEVIQEAIAKAESLKIPTPAQIRRKLKAKIKDSDGPWDTKLYQMAQDELDAEDEE